MRKVFILLSTAAFLVACEKPDNGQSPKPTPTPGPTPTVPIVVAAGTDLNPTITSDGGITKISFTANESWTAGIVETKSVDWITLDKTSGGAGNITLTVTVSPNQGYDDRSATVRLKSGSTAIDILFSQKQTDALIVAVSEIQVGEDGEFVEIKVEANIPYDYRIGPDAEGWISYVSTKALTARTLVFEVAGNESTSSREGSITISGEGFEHTVKISQAGKTPTVPIVVAADTDLNPTITSDGGDTKITFTANESWTATVVEAESVDWITLDKTSGGAGNITLTVTVSPNQGYDDRSATVRLKSGSTAIDILFSQKQTDALVVGVSEIQVGEDGDVIGIKVESNITYDYKIGLDGEGWISYISTKALTARTLVFEVAGNESTSSREGSITIFGEGFEHTVKISQAGKVPTVPIVVAAGTDLNPTITSDGGITKISFTANESWTAGIVETKSVDWITLDKTSGGAGDIVLTITVSPNPTYDDRSATVRLQSGSTTIDILFSQKQTDALVVGVSEIQVGEDGDVIGIKVESNITYDYKIGLDGEGWISYISTKALTARTLVFEVAGNESTSSREGSITIFGEGFEHTVKISQAGKVPTVPIVVAAGTDLNPTITSDGGDTKITFTASESWTASVVETKSVDWITLDKTSGGAGDIVLTITVSSNPTYDDRSATVRLQSGSTTIDILFSQKQTDALVVGVSEIQVGEDGDVIGIKVESNITYDYKIGLDGEGWISYISTKALTAQTLSFEVTRNESTSSREGSITIFGEGFEHTVKISQAGKVPTLNISQHEFDVGPEEGQIEIEVTGNIPAQIFVNDWWVWFNGQDQDSLDTYIFGISRNMSYESRTTYITFKNDEYNLQEVVIITQQPSNIVEIYDQNFKKYCIENFDTDGDENISFDEAKEVKAIEYYAERIDLQGLEAFINLETLKIGSGKSDIASAQQCYIWGEAAFASLTKLRHLECTYICLNSLDLSKMSELEYLEVEATNLYTLDVSNNKMLTYLDCSPSIYNNLQYLLLSKDQSIPNVTDDRNAEYVPENTIIYIDGVATGSGSEGTMEGGEI